MKQGLVLVEGYTEERFVNTCLGPYRAAKGLWLATTVVTNNATIGGPHAKGGVTRYGKVRRELRGILSSRGQAIITTLFDYYYALPKDFPGMADRPARRGARSGVEHVESAWAAEVDDRRFVPHIVLHELEAWVFADPARLTPQMFNDDATVVATIAAVASEHATPEDMDDAPDTAPSKRLKRVFPRYQKTVHGIEALKVIGVDRVRATCPHFASWLDKLEEIAAAP